MGKTTPDLSGKIFGFLTAIKYERGSKNNPGKWECLCKCGRTTHVRTEGLIKATTISCGCMRGKNTTHGMKYTPEYEAFQSAKARCNRRSCCQFKNYGLRGVKFLFSSFDEFIAHIGCKPSEEFSLDRIDTNGNYEPGNVRWASVEQQMNNMRTNRNIYIDGEVLTFAQWERKLLLRSGYIKDRVKRGTSPENVIASVMNSRKSGHSAKVISADFGEKR